MSHKPTPILVMSLMVILVLAVSAVAYGQWTQSLFINADVTTASFGVEWIDASAIPGVPLPVCEIDPADPTLASFTVDGGAPGDIAMCTYTLENAGDLNVVVIDPPLITPANFTDGVELDVAISDGFGATILPGDTLAVTLSVEVLDDAVPDTAYTFTVELVAEQAP